MKKTIHIIVVLLSVFTFAGCYSLDTTPPDAYSDATFWKNAEQVKQGVMGAYASLKNGYCFGYDFIFDSYTDICIGNFHQAFSLGTYDVTDNVVSASWQQTYDLVQRANAVIRNLKDVELDEVNAEGITAKIQATSIAEAKFLRALGYFRLLNLFGGVPYYDETVDLNSYFNKMHKARSSEAEIREKVLQDLTDAAAGLPDKWDAADYGRATKGAAIAFRGKVHLYNKDWSKAIADFESIVGNRTAYGYGLDESYEHIFKVYNGDRSPEMIFSIQNNAQNGMEMTSLMGSKASLRLIPSERSVPSNELVDLYENPDGSPFNWNSVFPGWSTATATQRRDMVAVQIDVDGNIISLLQSDTSKLARAYRDRDPRLMTVSITPYSDYLGSTSDSKERIIHYYLCNAELPNSGSPQEGIGLLRNVEATWTPSYFARKFVMEGNLKGYAEEYSRTPFEFPLMRYGDLLLMLSEAYNESGQLDKAVSTLNLVRERVGMPGLNSGASWMKVASKEEMTKRIRDERARELPLEGHRFFDIRRWGIGEQLLNNRQVKTIYGTTIYTQKYSSRDNLWPIPQIETERNSELSGSQNPGWGN